MTEVYGPLRLDDERLPAVRARLFLLVRSLAKAGVLRTPLVASHPAGALRLLAPVWQRLRVELLGERLLQEVLPRIERAMVSDSIVHREESDLNTRSPIDWPATWRKCNIPPHNTSLVTRHWSRNLSLPENRLALQALLELRYDATQVAHHLTFSETVPLRQLIEQTGFLLRRPPWRQVEAEKLVRASLARQRFRPPYNLLLAWWEEWERWRPLEPGTRSLHDPDLEPDKLFELLLLFEFVTVLAEVFPVRQTRLLASASTTPAFEVSTPQGTLEVFYQSGAMFAHDRSLPAIGAIPDMVLRLPGDEPRYVLLDAKNYGDSGHAQGIYKMVSYLYQFGYDGEGRHRFDKIEAGVVVFPTEEREGSGLRSWQREQPGAQAVFSFVLPPLPEARYTGLREFVEWLRARP